MKHDFKVRAFLPLFYLAYQMQSHADKTLPTLDLIDWSRKQPSTQSEPIRILILGDTDYSKLGVLNSSVILPHSNLETFRSNIPTSSSIYLAV